MSTGDHHIWGRFGPGWYPDPALPEALQWWDGYRWTGLRCWPEPVVDVHSLRLRIAGFVLLGLGLIAGWVPYPFIAGDGDGTQADDTVPFWVVGVGLAGLVCLIAGLVVLIVSGRVQRRATATATRNSTDLSAVGSRAAGR